MKYIDASTLEGGGQLPRLALCLSALTLTPIHLTQIRANRSSNATRRPRNPQSKDLQARGGIGGGGATPKPAAAGLKESHLAALHFLADASDARVIGDEAGSAEVTFRPRRHVDFGRRRDLSPSGRAGGGRGGAGARMVIELKNPGSVFLVWQAIWPYLIFCPRFNTNANLNPTYTAGFADGAERKNQEKGKEKGKGEEKEAVFELVLRGGTNVDKAMSVDYIQQVLIPVTSKIGLPKVEVTCVKRGWAGYAAQIGEVSISMTLPSHPTPKPSSTPPSEPPKGFILPAFQITDRGPIQKISITLLGTLDRRRSLKSKLLQKLTAFLSSSPELQNVEIEILIDEDSQAESRWYILLVAHSSNGWKMGRDHLGSEKKIRNEKEREIMLEYGMNRVVDGLKEEITSGACVDKYMVDQLVIFQALAGGESFVRGKDGMGTLHARTARWVCGEMLGGRGVRFDEVGGCTGVGWNEREERMDGIGVIQEAMKGLEIEESEEERS